MEAELSQQVIENLLDQNDKLQQRVKELEAQLSKGGSSGDFVPDGRNEIMSASTQPLTVSADCQVKTEQYINGQWVTSTNKDLVDVVNSNNREVIAKVPIGSKEDAAKACEAAAAAFPAWSQTPLATRKEYLVKIMTAFEKREKEVGDVIMKELGCTKSFAHGLQSQLLKWHFGALLANIDDFEWEKDYAGNISAGQAKTKVVKEPIGVVGCITPWNYPLNQISLKIGPALLAGCTVVLKPSEVTPLNAYILAEVIHSVGLPAGVFNMVVGVGPIVGEELSGNKHVAMMSFTGSTRAGIRVSQVAARTLKRVRTELGGKSAALMMPDSDLRAQIPLMMQQLMNNTGQSCNALSRMLVHKDSYDEAVGIAKAFAESVQPGRSEDDKGMGPLVSALQYDRVRALIKRGTEEARLVTGGLEKPQGGGMEQGYFVKPTVFADVSNSMDIARQEVFGPVLSMIPYDTVEQAVEIANDTDYGLNNAVSCPDVAMAESIARKLRSGQVMVNGTAMNFQAPFGGYKMSGEGREWGTYGLEEFLENKAIMVTGVE